MAEANTLIIVADTSGSMCEAGKRTVERNLLAYVRDRIRFGTQCGSVEALRLLNCGSRTAPVELADDDEILKLDTGGRATVEGLVGMLTRTLATTEQSRVLLFSDGQLAQSELVHFLSWHRANPQVSLRAISIGSDANLAVLGQMTGEGGVFPAEDIVRALDPWPLPSADLTPDPPGARSAAGQEGSPL